MSCTSPCRLSSKTRARRPPAAARVPQRRGGRQPGKGDRFFDRLQVIGKLLPGGMTSELFESDFFLRRMLEAFNGKPMLWRWFGVWGGERAGGVVNLGLDFCTAAASRTRVRRGMPAGEGKALWDLSFTLEARTTPRSSASPAAPPSAACTPRRCTRSPRTRAGRPAADGTLVGVGGAQLYVLGGENCSGGNESEFRHGRLYDLAPHLVGQFTARGGRRRHVLRRDVFSVRRAGRAARPRRRRRSWTRCSHGCAWRRLAAGRP